MDLIRTQTYGDVLVIGLRQTVTDDFSIADEFERAISEAGARGEHKILIQLTLVPYMTPVLLHTLTAAHKFLRDEGGALKLLKPNDQILAWCQQWGFDKVFEIYLNQEDALNSFEVER